MKNKVSNWRWISVALGCALIGLMAVQGRAQDSADSPAARRAAELVRLLDAGTRAEAKRYISENYAPSFNARIPLAQHLGFFHREQDQMRGVELVSVKTTGPAQATATVRSKLTGRQADLIISVETEAPHRISSIGMRRTPPTAAVQTAKRFTDEQMARQLDDYVKKLAGADIFSGAVLLANKDGQVIYRQAFGAANKDFDVPNKVDTKFNLGSMNKMFTAVAIAQLVERGKLSFDDPLAKFLPEYPDKDSAQKIKIKHLLTHTSGLGSYFNRKFIESSRALYRTVDDMMKLAAGEKLAFEPGTRSAYSNTGMLVLGAVIEKATGQSYFDYIRENIYKPAGMINSDAYELDYVTPNLAVGYEKEFTDQGVRFKNNIFSHVLKGGPAGGGYSTVDDLLRFADALRSGKLVGKEYVATLLSAKPELNSPNYGYGFAVNNEWRIVGHSGGFDGISSNLDLYLSNGYTAVVLSNYGGGSGPVLEKLREVVLTGTAAQVSQR
jgi:CubicO group peptidase (beta-lactamase class C family)